jgi:hypothetical protein
MEDSNQFNETKSALLRHYTSNQTSQGARLIGFTVALFTLLQTVQHSRQEPLSRIFSNIDAFLPQVAPGFAASLKFLLFFCSVLALFFFIFHAIFRFIVFAYFSDSVIRVKQSEISLWTEGIHQDIHVAARIRMEETKKRIYGVFPTVWFVAKGEESQHWKGWIACFFLALCSTLILMLFLW